MAENKKDASPGIIISRRWIENPFVTLTALGLITYLEYLLAEASDQDPVNFADSEFWHDLQQNFPNSCISELIQQLVSMGYLVRKEEGGQ